MIGTQILHYRIDRKLGEGGMGAVYLAENTHLHQRVALKFLPPQFSDDPELKARLEREAVAAAALSHPNIVTVHDLHEHEGQPFIAMEYLEGSTLSAWCTEQDPSIGEILDVAMQIGEGLKKAHEAGVVHRDLKPANIIVDRDGRPKILDFGLAQLKGATKVTATGSTMGTARYTSPEQGQGQKVDQRTDLWSLGVILYEMIARRLPFEAEHEAAVTYAIAHEEPEPLARYKKGVSDDLHRLVSKCLAKDPNERYQSSADLVADLKRLGTAPAPVQRGRKRLWLVAAATVVFATAGYVVVDQFRKPQGDIEDGWTNSVAVLIFRNLSGDSEQDLFCEGMTDEIIGRLSTVKGLKVTSMQSMLRFRGTDLDLKAIGKELEVDNILEGSLQQSGDSIRVRAQLIRVDDDAHIWTDKYDRKLSSIFAIQDGISLAIVDVLQGILVGDEAGFASRRGTDDIEAYDAYVRGRHFWRKRNEDDLRTAIAYFEEAKSIDSGYALAYSGLADAWRVLPVFGNVTERHAYPIADKASLRAVQLGPGLAEAHASRGLVLSGMRKLDAAEAAYLKSIELNPNYAWGHLWYSTHLHRLGRHKERMKHLRIAYELDPLSLIVLNNLALEHSRAGEVAPVEELANRMLQMEPEYFQAYQTLANTYLNSGDTSSALETVNLMVNRLPQLSRSYLIQGRILSAMGRVGEARQAYQKGIDLSPDSWNPHYALGSFLVGQRQYEEAVELLSRAIDLDPNQHLPHVQYAWLLGQMGNTTNALRHNKLAVELAPYDAEAHRAYGWSLANWSKDYDQAIQLILRATELNPRFPRAYNSLSWVYALVEDFEKSLWAINKSLEISPGDAFPLRRKARILALAGHVDSSIHVFRQYLLRQPTDIYAIEVLGDMYTALGRYDEADSIFGLFTSLPDPTTQGLYRMVTALPLIHQARFGEALSHLSQGIEADRVELGASAAMWWKHLYRGTIYLTFLQKPGFAGAEFQTALEINKGSPSYSPQVEAMITSYSLWAMGASGETRRAQELLEHSLGELEPVDGYQRRVFTRSLASIYRQQGDFEASVALLENLVLEEPDFDSRLYLGISYLELGRYDEVIAVIEGAIGRYDDGRLTYPAEALTAHYYLAQAYEATGRVSDAIDQYTILLDFWRNADPGVEMVEDAKARLARLKDDVG